ncbi:alpha/beta-hydrolase [Tilletiaria anomala UBC 951]|uniref:triacylglycerol lipase n=1 Tax=Tilletiaria anomala (strain ATCC 24038 / CBS 436.72 / UBC 951) TaxID=1037660 RepID=A0A066VU52_TILAU|nr:alpha/beta-hydrolase [Tilletiaria anomala UBC 951]KDN45252.1 alpha/beta-hydrolase [Tilletiaria anomala UBC 951]
MRKSRSRRALVWGALVALAAVRAPADVSAATTLPSRVDGGLVPAALPVISWLDDRLTDLLSAASSWRNERRAPQPEPVSGESKMLSFRLAQSVHKGVYDYPELIAWTHHSRAAGASEPEHNIHTVKQAVTRARDVRAYLAARGQSLEQAQCATREMLDWEDVEVDAPDVSHRPTLLALATMASQAYENRTDTWQGYGGFNLSESFGWVEDGIRGHLFTTEDNSTVVVAIKGTSAQFLPGGGDTAKRDKANDNLFFSCCCARVSWTWTPVCDCYQGKGSRCGQTCLERALVEKSFYYQAATDLYNNVSYLYPDSQIWITGHSLGGALSSLIGMTFGVPTVTFEAPGERMAAMRLHLPLPPAKEPEESPVSALPITHVYHNADPLAVGDCVGPLSPCGQFGYAMESKCHAGKSIVYDTVGRLGWSSSLLTHRIATLTDDLLTQDWNERVKNAARHMPASATASFWRWPWKKGEGDEQVDDDLQAVPPRLSEDKCRDCADWTFSDEALEDS